MQDVNEKVVLGNRAFLYAYIARAFAVLPDQMFLTLVVGENATQQCALFDNGEDEGFAIQEALRECLQEVTSSGVDLEAEYARLFEAPGSLPVPVWESVHLCGEPLLFQESTLAVREAYRKAGYQSVGYPAEPDDHIATELNFMAALATQTCEAYEANDVTEVERLLSLQADFLQNHLLVWIRDFSDRMNALDGISSFYPSFAALAALTCERDAGVIEELLAEL